MTNKFVKQPPGLLLESKIRENYNQVPPLIIKNSKMLSPSTHHHTMNSPLHRKSSQHKLQQQTTTSDQSFYANSLPASLKRLCSFDSMGGKASTELGRLQEQKQMLQRNFIHEVQYYIRLRKKDLMTVQDLLLANQYQRLLKYVETELALLKKKHEDFLIEETFCKPTPTRDTFIKSTLEDDIAYKQIINNLIANLQHNEKNFNHMPSTLKKLNVETDLSTKKLANYLQQSPFQIKSSQTSTNLATKLINQLGYCDGHQILQFMSKSVQQFSKGKYNMPIQQPIPKSEMSKLIQQHSLTKIKSKKSFN